MYKQNLVKEIQPVKLNTLNRLNKSSRQTRVQNHTRKNRWVKCRYKVYKRKFIQSSRRTMGGNKTQY